jgi:hypothetical protein
LPKSYNLSPNIPTCSIRINFFNIQKQITIRNTQTHFQNAEVKPNIIKSKTERERKERQAKYFVAVQIFHIPNNPLNRGTMKP